MKERRKEGEKDMNTDKKVRNEGKEAEREGMEEGGDE